MVVDAIFSHALALMEETAGLREDIALKNAAVAELKRLKAEAYNPPMVTTREKLQTSVARMMAAAYWRGRLEQAAVPVGPREAMIKAAAELDLSLWMDAAKVAIGDALLVPAAENGGSSSDCEN